MNSRVVHAVAGVAALCLLVAVLAVAGCGSSLPSTPEELFAQVKEHQTAGDMGKVWDLLTEEQRAHEIRGIDNMRAKLAREPGALQLVAQYNCSWDEFQRLTYVQIYDKQHKPYVRKLVGASVSDRQTDPRKPDEVVLSIRLEGDERLLMRAKQVDGGWRLIGFEPTGK